jgi:hypothetical protein
MDKKFDAFIEEYRQRIHNDESIEDVIAHLHMEGLTITDSMKALRLLYTIPLGEAKKLVAAHPVWLSVVQVNEPFHVELEPIAKLLSKPDVSDDDIKNYEKKENEK